MTGEPKFEKKPDTGKDQTMQEKAERIRSFEMLDAMDALSSIIDKMIALKFGKVENLQSAFVMPDELLKKIKTGMISPSQQSLQDANFALFALADMFKGQGGNPLDIAYDLYTINKFLKTTDFTKGQKEPLPELTRNKKIKEIRNRLFGLPIEKSTLIMEEIVAQAGYIRSKYKNANDYLVMHNLVGSTMRPEHTNVEKGDFPRHASVEKFMEYLDRKYS